MTSGIPLKTIAEQLNHMIKPFHDKNKKNKQKSASQTKQQELTEEEKTN